MREWDLSALDWTLRGWRQNDWELALTPERAKVRNPDVGPLDASVPGSVRGALLAHGMVPDPMFGQDSRLSEWTENRHWTFSTVLPRAVHDALATEPGLRAVFECAALDSVGVVLLDETIVGSFENAFIPYRCDLTELITAESQVLSVVFTNSPDGLGQNGWTSRIRDWKARFNYGWDWTPRIVQIGIPGALTISVGSPESLHGMRVTARLSDCRVRVDLSACRLGTDGQLEVSITGAGGQWDRTFTLGELLANDSAAEIDVPEPQLWQVLPVGEQPFYSVRVRLRSAWGEQLDETSRTVAFRRIEWHVTEDAPDGADGWLCVVNGKPIFLAGVNWVPIRPDYADVTDEDYRVRLTAYRDLGMNFVRVWGGAAAEQDVFYDICDELGLLVWQELPLSSSGLDNEPPSDSEYAEQLASIARHYATRLAHHACLAMWGGGNELTRVTAPAVPGAPLTIEHPALAAAEAAFEECDPTRRFVATSPLGPRFEADAKEFGNGVHHDVHGPWEHAGSSAEWQEYWDSDDATMRSEVGVSGASSMDLLEHFGLVGDGGHAGIEARAELRQLWTHSSGWWLGQFDASDAEQPIAEWIASSQQRQAEMLSYAAASTLARFPRCAGFVVWLGHDTFPCAVSLSLLDFWGRPKPAALALRDLFADDPRLTSR